MRNRMNGSVEEIEIDGADSRGEIVEDADLKILVVPNTMFFPPYLDEIGGAGLHRDEPRSWIHDIKGEVVYLDQRLHTNPPALLRKLYARLPMWLVQVCEVYRTGRNFDVVFIWSLANVALVLGMLLKLSFRKMTCVVLLTRISERKKAWLLKLVHSSITKIILPPQRQRQIAVEELGIPSDKLVGIPWTADINFWSRTKAQQERMMICAAGGEMRDYRTLVEALRGLDIDCHIAGALDTSRKDWWNSNPAVEAEAEDIPQNITFGSLSPVELRNLYGRSLFIVVPLKPTTSDNGITCMNEAWAMGCPVVVSDVEGQQGAFTDGQEGLWVQQGDPAALRDAILALWNDPQRAREMGRAGRALVEKQKGHRVFSDALNEIFLEVSTQGAPDFKNVGA